MTDDLFILTPNPKAGILIGIAIVMLIVKSV